MKKIAFSLFLFLFGCQTAMPFPEMPELPESPRLPNFFEQRSIAFEKAFIDLPRGQTYIAYPYWRLSFDHVHFGLLESCNVTSNHRFGNSVADWSMGEKKFGEWQSEAATFVNKPLQEMGYDVVDAYSTTFRRQREKRRAELLLSARITDIKSNQCHLFNLFLFKGESLIGGDAYVQVEWEVYDTLADKVIAKFSTTGIGIVEKPTEKGHELILLRALSDAADRLGREKGFYHLITQQDVLDDLIEDEEKDKPILLDTHQKMDTRPLNEHAHTAKKAVVSVAEEASGFFITREGHILTTAEAVGSARYVPISDSQGMRYQAQVLKTNTRLNVALLKAVVTKTYYFPIAREELLTPLMNVYTIGNPDGFRARSSLTHGKISSVRYKSKKRQNFIQADITTTSGYAGAPLLDEYGNVLGLHDGRNSDETAFSYFIPIHDALRALNIKSENKS